MGRKAIFIGATGQNVGKTTICLGLIAGLKKKFPAVGFMKPVGQQHETVEDCILVDKDVVLFKEHFHLQSSYQTMSPVIIPKGYTRAFLDGKINQLHLEEKIVNSFNEVSAQNDFTLIEGTGHVGVGSIVGLSNAYIASLLKLDIVLIAGGGLGAPFDELALNKALCDAYGVKVVGVILNKVMSSKQTLTVEYMKKALGRWHIPLIGCVPYDLLLSLPSMENFETLFKTRLLAGARYHYKHFDSIRLVATSVDRFREMIPINQLIVTPATREDILYALIARNNELNGFGNYGVILTGRHPPSTTLIENLQVADIPTLYADKSSFAVMQMISSFTGKTRKDDILKIKKAIELVEASIDFNVF